MKKAFPSILANSTLLFLVLLLVLPACKTAYYPTNKEASFYSLDTLATTDAAVEKIIAPYKEKLEAAMNVVIGHNAVDMPKEQPESLMGNFVADAILDVARTEYGKPIDFCISNYGGLRIPTLPKGDITKGRIFELMPFDNMLVIVHLDGATTQTFLNHVAVKGGWPASKELKMNINGNQAEQITINGEAFDPNKKYSILVSDYMANGGDKCSFLKGEDRNDLSLLFRDAIMQFVEKETKAGREINAAIEGRINLASGQ